MDHSIAFVTCYFIIGAASFILFLSNKNKSSLVLTSLLPPLFLCFPYTNFGDFKRALVEISSPEPGNIKYILIAPYAQISSFLGIQGFVSWKLFVFTALSLLIVLLWSKKSFFNFPLFSFLYYSAFPLIILHYRQGMAAVLFTYGFFILDPLCRTTGIKKYFYAALLFSLSILLHPVFLLPLTVLLLSLLLSANTLQFKLINIRQLRRVWLNYSFKVFIAFLSSLIFFVLFYSRVLSFLPFYSSYAYWIDFSNISLSNLLPRLLLVFYMMTLLVRNYQKLNQTCLYCFIFSMALYATSLTFELITGLSASARTSSSLMPIVLYCLLPLGSKYNKTPFNSLMYLAIILASQLRFVLPLL